MPPTLYFNYRSTSDVTKETKTKGAFGLEMKSLLRKKFSDGLVNKTLGIMDISYLEGARDTSKLFCEDPELHTNTCHLIYLIETYGCVNVFEQV